MKKTDRQTDKSTRWQFTAYEDQYNIVDSMSKSAHVAEYGWNPEICPETQRPHRQGYLRTKTQVRFSFIIKEFPGIHFEVAKNWEALKNYCKKEETREKGKKSFSGTGRQGEPLTMANALMRLASYADPKPVLYSIPLEELNEVRGIKDVKTKWEWAEEYDSKAQYVSAVKNWLKIDPTIISLVSQPQYKAAYSDFWKEFQDLAINSLEFCGEGYSITPEPDEEVVEPPEDEWREYSFLD